MIEADAGSEITELLHRIGRGDAGALDALMPAVYGALHDMAAHLMAHETGNLTLQTTALVHEAYLQLAQRSHFDCESRRQFYAVAAHAMRCVLIDHARHRRLGQLLSPRWLLIEDEVQAAPALVDVIALDEALRRLERLDERQFRVVELRIFAGLSIEETARTLQLSEVTVKRDWSMARVFLERWLGPR